MEPEKQVIPSTSKNVLKPKKKPSREGSVCSDKSMSKAKKHQSSSGKSGKPAPAVNKEMKNLNKQPSQKLQHSVARLHERTKVVRSKLKSMQKSKIPPKLTNPPNNIQNNIVALPTSIPNNKLLTEQDVLREIERLKELMKQMQLQNNSNDIKAAESGQKSTEDKQKRPKKRKKITDVKELQKLYASHINQIITKDDKEVKDVNIPEYKIGDDLEEFAAKCVEAGLGQIVESEVRVNAKNNHQAFITVDGGSDAMILSLAARKYAMEGDLVRAFVRNKSEGTRESVCDLDETIPSFGDPNETIDDPEDVLVDDVEILKKSEEAAMGTRDRAFVIRIIKESGNRQFVGSIAFKNPDKHDDGEYFKFKTRDTKAPIMCIPVESCDEILKQGEAEDILGFLFVAQILKIEENGRCLGKLIAPVGKVGDLQSEIKAILMHNKLNDVQNFEQRFEDMWAEPINIEASDLVQREDLRLKCIFTIDPLTARDLDDAVSCEVLSNGDYEIGVHISDVTHFLEESCELDEMVKLRATSIYLVNEVIHMLPQTLCMKCSLLPNEDKFTFSVFWVMDKEANVKSTRFTRSVIRSCTQLAYEHAQKIIDNPDETFTENDFPSICNGYTADDIVTRVKMLNSLAEVMRKRRFANGSLSIDKPQFYFHFDTETGEPTSYEICSRLTANFLIEEFMLLANQSVAEFIYKHFPDIAFLRSHQPPKASAIKSLKVKLNAVGIELDMSTSESIFKGLKKICGSSSQPELVGVAMNYLLTKPMMRAKYFCSENVDEESGLRHYALAIPIYTHFTSPIRRYPDILVHRLLSAALKYTTPPKRTPEELHELARVCNDQKFNAKNAGEESSNLYFKRYIKEKKHIDVQAVVVDIYKHCIEAITLDTGHLIYVPYKLQKTVVDSSKAPSVVYISEQNSTKPRMELKMFSPVNIRLTIWDDRLTGFFISPDPEQRRKNEIAAAKAKIARKEDYKCDESSQASSELNARQRRNRRRKRTRKPKGVSGKASALTDEKTKA